MPRISISFHRKFIALHTTATGDFLISSQHNSYSLVPAPGPTLCAADELANEDTELGRGEHNLISQ